MLLSTSSQREFISAALKCIGISATWLSIYVLAPSFVDGNDFLSDLLSCGDDKYLVIKWCAFSYCTWFIPGLLYLCFDVYNESNGQLSSRRVQYPNRKPLEKVNWYFVHEAIRLTAINTITSIIALAFIWNPMMKWRGQCDPNMQSSTIWNLMKTPLLLIGVDIWFYGTHRTFHYFNWLYQNVHKVHHQFVDTYALCATACHPLEQIITNQGAAFIPCFLLGLPPSWGHVWLWIANLNAVNSHSGYVLWKGSSAIPHDFHHHFMNTEFGAGKRVDALFKTNLQSLYADKYPVIMEPYSTKDITKSVKGE